MAKFDDTEIGGREYGPVNLKLSGDRNAALAHTGRARTVLGALKNQMNLAGVMHSVRQEPQPDGSVIQVSSIRGSGGMADTDAIHIYAPPPPPSQGGLRSIGFIVTQNKNGSHPAGFPQINVTIPGDIHFNTNVSWGSALVDDWNYEVDVFTGFPDYGAKVVPLYPMIEGDQGITTHPLAFEWVLVSADHNEASYTPCTTWHLALDEANPGAPSLTAGYSYSGAPMTYNMPVYTEWTSPQMNLIDQMAPWGPMDTLATIDGSSPDPPLLTAQDQHNYTVYIHYDLVVNYIAASNANADAITPAVNDWYITNWFPQFAGTGQYYVGRVNASAQMGVLNTYQIFKGKNDYGLFFACGYVYDDTQTKTLTLTEDSALAPETAGTSSFFMVPRKAQQPIYLGADLHALTDRDFGVSVQTFRGVYAKLYQPTFNSYWGTLWTPPTHFVDGSDFQVSQHSLRETVPSFGVNIQVPEGEYTVITDTFLQDVWVTVFFSDGSTLKQHTAFASGDNSSRTFGIKIGACSDRGSVLSRKVTP